MIQLLLLAALGVVNALQPDASQLDGLLLDRRGLPNSPSGGYAPRVVDCPQTRPTIRSAGSGLSPDESSWLSLRRNATVGPMMDFLRRAGIRDFNAVDYISSAAGNVSALPNVGIAVSGGGYRALMNGAGFLMAADDRTPGTTGTGGIGGLLQSATYLSGLSGGGWLVGSIYSNNFSTVVRLRDQSNVWKFDRSILTGPAESGSSIKKILKTADYWLDILGQVKSKKESGFETSLTDYWGRALAYQLIDDLDGGPAYTFSSIAKTDAFKNGSAPFPIIVADGRAPGTRIISLNSTVFEFNPFELGTWDPTTFGFAPLEYIASNFTGGQVPQSGGKCVRGFDSASFVMGTSSSLFNQILLQNISAQVSLPSAVIDVIKGIATEIGNDNNDIAQYVPNPFLGFHNQTAGGLATSTELDLVDGGSDLQNIPLQPLIQPSRRVDVIFAVDSSADTKFNWPNGTALRATYDRAKSSMANGTLFPHVPDDNTFVNLGLNNRPTFFGCDVNNLTAPLSRDQPLPPLVVYIPNAPYTVMPNVSTFTMSYPLTQRNDIILNAYNGATQGNGTLDSEWPACVACAVLHRSMLRRGSPIPAQCNSCFSRYCWTGNLNATARGETGYQPAFKIGNQTTVTPKSAASRLGGNSFSLTAVSLAALAASVCMVL